MQMLSHSNAILPYVESENIEAAKGKLNRNKSTLKSKIIGFKMISRAKSN